MRRFAASLVLLTATAVIGACGIGPGPVVKDRKAEQADQRLNPVSSKDLMRPDRARDPVDLVRRYLKAAADKPETRVKTLLSYMQDKNWTPSGEINIYRVDEPAQQGQTGTIIPVSVPMQKVGKLLKDGRIEPVYAARVETLFNVVDGADGYLLKDAPGELMLSDLMLQSDWYEPRPIYFWDKAGTRLVADIRYVAGYAPEQEKARLLVEALYAGPSPWLSQAVKPAAGQVRKNPEYNADGTMSIDLQSQLGDEELSRLANQLERTLKTSNVDGVQLKIQGVSVQPGRFRPVNDSEAAARYAVRLGKVVRLNSGSARAGAPLPLTDEINAGVQWAMFSRDEESVAISRMEGNVRQFLIGPSQAPWPVAISEGKQVDQVVWLEGASRAALLLSDRKLYEVVPGENATPTQLAGSLPGPVTGFSVLPDGRIALVIDKKLYMAALYRGAGGLIVTQPQQVPTALDQVQHVALKENNAIIAGVGHEQKLVLTQINLDGALQLPTWKDYNASEQISHLVADYRTGAAFYDYGKALQLGPGGATEVGESQVVQPPGASPSPTPSASPAPPPITAASFEG